LVVEKNKWKMNSRGEQNWRREELDGDGISWVTKKFAGKSCRGWKMAEGVVSVVTHGDSGCASREG
jgi:hypothetical protein